MTHTEILNWLRETDTDLLADLWRQADAVREKYVGNEVHLRGLIEVSNYCSRLCGYCGLRAENRCLTRYRMSDEEIMACVFKAQQLGYGTVVLQSGEDYGLTTERIAGLVKRIKQETNLAVTLSLGERSDDELAEWRKAGADRYLLRFETSNRQLYEKIHPPLPGKTERNSDRLAILKTLRQLGYEVGSGVMIGIPGQTWDDLARDIELFSELDLDMIGVGPYIPHPATPLAAWSDTAGDQQVPNSEEMTYKVIALARLVCPRANIPATTALATINTNNGRELGLLRGANVIMPNLTPQKYRSYYEIYPNKACLTETADTCYHCITGRITAIGRSIGTGRGDSPNYGTRRTGVI